MICTAIKGEDDLIEILVDYRHIQDKDPLTTGWAGNKINKFVGLFVSMPKERP